MKTTTAGGNRHQIGFSAARRYLLPPYLISAALAAAAAAATLLLPLPGWAAGGTTAGGLVDEYLQPHGHGICLAWQPYLLWLHVASDALVAIAYYSIPVALLVLVRRRHDLQFGWMFVLFSLFILACGTTHIMSIWTLWDPVYLASGLMKAVTALLSVITAVILWPLIGKALALPGPAQWKAVHEELQNEVAERRRAEDEVRLMNTGLEEKVEERTRQLLEAQDLLIRKEKLAILGQLSGSVGHELRNPLGVMSNAIYFLKMVLSETDETTREYLEIIKKEIDNSQRIITDLLDFARTKSPQIRTVAVKELTDQSLEKCLIPENVTMTVELPETLPPLWIDPLQMIQVLQNLITNGIQAMPGGGMLRIAAHHPARTTVDKDKDGKPAAVVRESGRDFIEIAIEDTGEGITVANMNKLFQPLFTTKARGIGLGLVVCRNLTEANGGRIEVASTVGRGTTFAVVLPVAQETGVLRG